jgi:hypothetical protein
MKLKTTNNNKNLFHKAFYCCYGLNEKTPEIKFEENSNSNSNHQSINEINQHNKQSSIYMYTKYIRSDEKNKIKYTKQGILDFINYLTNLEYSTKYESDGYKISIRDSSELSKDTLLIRYSAIINKNLFLKGTPNVIEMLDAIKNPENNTKWNIYNKEFIILKRINENADIVKKITVKQINIIPEKEYYNKRIFFYNEGIAYYFTSSIPDNIYPVKDENFRALNYLETFVIKEDNYSFLFDIFQQLDIKMSIQPTILMINLPEKLKEYFDKLIEFFNS